MDDVLGVCRGKYAFQFITEGGSARGGSREDAHIHTPKANNQTTRVQLWTTYIHAIEKTYGHIHTYIHFCTHIQEIHKSLKTLTQRRQSLGAAYPLQGEQASHHSKEAKNGEYGDSRVQCGNRGGEHTQTAHNQITVSKGMHIVPGTFSCWDSQGRRPQHTCAHTHAHEPQGIFLWKTEGQRILGHCWREHTLAFKHKHVDRMHTHSHPSMYAH